MSREIRVALLAIAAVGLFYIGYKFILGSNVLTVSNIYYVKYDHVNLLKPSTPVTISGVQIGFVSNVEPMLDSKKVKVTLDLDRNVKVPKNTVAVIKATSFMGGQAVELIYDDPCAEGNCAASGSFLKGASQDLLSSLVDRQAFESYLSAVERTLGSIVDTINQQLLSEDAEGPIANSLRDLESTMANLKTGTSRLDGLIARSSSGIEGTINNLQGISDTINANNGKIASILSNTDKVVGELSEAELAATVQDIRTTVDELKTLLGTADAAFVGINGIVSKLENGDGTLGKLINDGALYQDLSQLSEQADTLINDIQERPYRYVPFKGRNRVKRYDRKDARQENTSGTTAASSNN